MSSVTPRERREVAKSLRYLADLPGEPLENDGQFIEVLKYWIFADFKRYSYDETLTRLADLIDPVCHAVVDLESDGIGAPYRYTSRCSNCGQVWGEAIYFPHVPIYCPACGARVVRDDL